MAFPATRFEVSKLNIEIPKPLECLFALVKQKEPSLVRSGTKPPNDNHFWPIFAGADGGIVNPVARKMSFKGSCPLKRDAPDRMLAAPLSGDGDADGADGENLVCCFALTIGRR